MKNSPLYYSVGPLLYCPANHTDIADSIIQEKFLGVKGKDKISWKKAEKFQKGIDRGKLL